MKNNQPVTQTEFPLTDSDTIISTTDLKGVVLSINEDFLRIAGFPEEELIGRAHNVVRHPDMPQAAFKDLWSCLKDRRPWMGLVKNRCKNGDHYYVDAYVTPIYEQGQAIGFQSVRFKPEREVIDRAEAFYRLIRENKPLWLQKLKPANISFKIKAWLLASVIALPLAGAGVYAANQLLVIMSLLVFLLGGALVYWLIHPLVTLAERSKQYFNNPITQAVYTGRDDELGQLEVVLKAQRSQNRTILGRVENAAAELGKVAAETNQIVEETTAGVQRQQMEVEQMATAMNEMVATVAEVARNAEITASSSSDVLQKTAGGEQLVGDSIQDISALSTTVSEATAAIEKLKVDSQNIGSVVDVISNIASETNLLALNAAIEAARAGEQGRGFAVVADEVRNLASNTQRSTDEIQQMIKAIQQSSSEAVTAMGEGSQRADQSVEQASQVEASFGDISASIDEISGMNAQVATAAEEQSVVAEEINRNVVAINDVAHTTLDNANATAVASGRLNNLVHGLQSMVKQFGDI